MGLVSVAEILADAKARSYAVGAFNLNNMEILQAIIGAAEAERSPVILQASQGGIAYAGLEYIAAMAKVAAEKATVPVALNLDHGTSFEQAVRCIRHGFSAVMIDGSHHPYSENVSICQRVVAAAQAVGVSVEGELGRIGGTEDDISVDEKDAMLADPNEVVSFVAETDVDCLAVAIGTAHGVYHGEPKLDFERLAKIRSLVEIPLVLHGASGVSDEDIKQAIARGICKINIDTELRQAFSGAVRGELAADPSQIDPRKLLGPARSAMEEVVREKLRLFGSSQKA